MSRLAPRVAQRDGPHIQHHVALTDGAEALQQQVVTHFPQYTLVLDIIHATEYLWDTANALLGETHPQRPAWVRAYLESLLAGQTDAVITALEAEAHDPTCTVTQRQACGGRWAPTDGTSHICTTINIWRVVGRLGRVGGRRLWAPRERSHGAVRDALD